MARLRKTAESASFQRGSPGGKKVPMSPAAMAPSSASVMACSSTSPSEWPARPSGWSSVSPPMRSGTPGMKACESKPNPILVSMVTVPVLKELSGDGSEFLVQPESAGALAEVELGQLQVALLGNLQINLRTVDHGYRKAGALHDRGLVGADKAVRGGLGKGALEQAVAEALRGLRQHDELAGDGRGHEGAVGGALHLLDGVHGRHADDGRPELGDRVDGAVDGGDIDQRAHSVVDQHDVVGLGGEGGQCVGNRFLAVVAALDYADAAGKAVLGCVLGYLGLNALDLGFAHGHVDRRYPLHRGKSAQRMNQDGEAVEG